MVFCNTKAKCHDLTEKLKKRGFSVLAIHGDLEQRERDQVLSLFSNKSNSILVATDVAARGLDIKDLGAVVNYELARNPEIHIHRIGRTGRANKKGLAVSFFTKREEPKIKAIAEAQGIKIVATNPESLAAQKVEQLTPTMTAMRIEGGKKNKLRPTDILGALTMDGLAGAEVGKIDIFDFHSIVAIQQKSFAKALQAVTQGTIKGRSFKVRRV